MSPTEDPGRDPLTRACAAAALFGGLVWFFVPVAYGLGDPPYDGLPPVGAVLAAGPPLLVVGLVGFYRRYGSAHSLLGRAGVVTLAVGLSTLLVLALPEFVTVPIGAGLVFLSLAGFVSLFAVLAGVLLVAVDCWRTGVPSRRMALWFPLSLPVCGFCNYLAGSDGFVPLVWLDGHVYAGFWGLAWIGVGIVLLSE